MRNTATSLSDTDSKWPAVVGAAEGSCAVNPFGSCGQTFDLSRTGKHYTRPEPRRTSKMRKASVASMVVLVAALMLPALTRAQTTQPAAPVALDGWGRPVVSPVTGPKPAPAPRRDLSGIWEPANGPGDGIQPNARRICQVTVSRNIRRLTLLWGCRCRTPISRYLERRQFSKH